MKNGVISQLFEQLYFTVFTAVNIILFAVIGVSRHFYTDSENEPILIAMCLKKPITFQHQHTSWITYGGFMFVVFIITWLMYGSSRYLIYSKSKNGKLPQKFGRYQRNVVTFYQTVLLNSVQEMFFAFLAFWPSFKIKPENVQIYTLIILLIYGLVLDFLMPIILISAQN